MKLKRFNNFINESVNNPIAVEVDFASPDDVELIDYDEYPEKAEKQMKGFIEDWIKEYGKDKITGYDLVIFNDSSAVVEFKAKNISDLYDAMLVFNGDDIEQTLWLITDELIMKHRCQEAFDIVKEKKPDYLKDINFPKEFIESLGEEDKNLLTSVKGIEKYDL